MTAGVQGFPGAASGTGTMAASAARQDLESCASAPDLDSRLASAAVAVKIATAVVAPLVGALAVLGAIGSFATVRHLAVPWFGSSAWIVPVGVDIGILALLAWDLLAEYLGLS